MLLSPDYLPAMRRRRSSDALGDTASNLGNAMDELMRHQHSLKEAATGAIVKLLEEVCSLGRDPKYICWKAQQKLDSVSNNGSLSRQNNTNVEAGGSSDEEDEEEEETATTSETNTRGEASTSAPSTSGTSSSNNKEKEKKEKEAEKEAVPLVDYIHNVMKFVDAILSNNSTDDHCREFVSQKGLVPLMGILGLPNLPIDFPAQQACQSVAAVCKSILNLAHEPQVLKEGLHHLNQVLKNLEPLHTPLEPPGGSVLLHELVSSPNISEATSNPQATPLLHHMSAAHAYIQMFIHVCRTGQSDIRTISVSHWGSELGLMVLKGLSRLYTSLVWESTVLLALCSEDTLPTGCEFGKSDMDKLLPQSVVNPTSSENEETFSPSSGTESNSSVTMAMENLSTEPSVIMAMDIDNQPPQQQQQQQQQTSTNVVEKKDSKYNPALHHQIKQIKPLLSASSRLGRALAELFALLVKLCVGSPLRQRRGQHIPPTPAPPSPPARAVASALTKLLASGLSWEPPSTSPIPRFRLTFFICSVGFTAPMLFDEKKFPFHLMLMKFMSSGGQRAFFDTFYWSLSCGGKMPPQDGLESEELPDGTGEFLDSWLMLLEKMVNPKAVLESPHTLPAKPSGSFHPFDPMKYLIRTHKLAFHAVMKIWGKKPLKVYGARMAESVLSILCHILQGEKIIAERLEKDKSAEKSAVALAAARFTSTSSVFGGTPTNTVVSNPITESLQQEQLLHSPSRSAVLPGSVMASALAEGGASSSSNVAQPPPPPPAASEPEINQQQLETLMDMGFPRERCIEAIQSTGSLDQATEYLLTTPQVSTPLVVVGGEQPPQQQAGPSIPPPANPSSGSSIPVLGEQDELMRAIAMSLGENVMMFQDGASSSSTAATNDYDFDIETSSSTPNNLEDEVALSKSIIDEFTNQALSGCLSLLDTLPDTVFRACDLLLAVFNRNGKEFKEEILKTLIQEVNNSIQVLLGMLEDGNNDDNLIKGEHSGRAAARIHLFILLFEECKLLCAKIVQESNVVKSMTQLLAKTFTVLKSSQDSITPKWMTPLLLFIDLHEKVVLGMNRRAALISVILIQK